MRSLSIKGFVISMILSLTFLSGCASGAQNNNTATKEETKSAQLEVGWKAYQPTKESYSLGLPAEWKFIDLNAKDFAKQDTTLDATTLEGFANQGATFLGYDPASIQKGKGPINVNVIAKPLNGMKITLEQLSTTYEKTIKTQMPTAEIHNNEQVNLPIGKALKIKLTGSLGANLKFSTIQYMILKNANFYTVTFTSTPDKDAKYEPIFDKIIKTFEIK